MAEPTGGQQQSDPTIQGEAKNEAPFTNPAGGGTTNANYLNAMTLSQIQAAAKNQVANEITGTVTPLQSQIGSLQGQMGGALKEIGGMFGTLLPYASQESGAVSSSYDEAMRGEAAIFGAATQQLNQLRQQRSAEA